MLILLEHDMAVMRAELVAKLAFIREVYEDRISDLEGKLEYQIRQQTAVLRFSPDPDTAAVDDRQAAAEAEALWRERRGELMRGEKVLRTTAMLALSNISEDVTTPKLSSSITQNQDRRKTSDSSLVRLIPETHEPVNVVHYAGSLYQGPRPRNAYQIKTANEKKQNRSQRMVSKS